MATITDTPTNAARYAALRRMLEERRRMLTDEIQEHIREVRDRRAPGGEPRDGLDDIEIAEVDIQDDIGMALIQMKAEGVRQIDEGLERLRADEYGYCFDCAAEIPEKRLRALPFAVRCRSCEEAREADRERRGRLFPLRDHRGAATIGSQAL